MKYILLMFTLIFGGCSVKNYEHTQAKVIVIKSPKIKFADLGYIRNNEKSIELELFIAGKVIEKININHLVCVREGCMSKGSFNENYLSAFYPSDILQNILLGHVIYGGENILRHADGFEQHISNGHVEIVYTVAPHAIFFKDKKNNILIKIKDMQQRSDNEQ
ncbi:hypothetical protein KKC15_02845 [bacterium]|nr:hypothetical protein [bacterium]